MALTLTATLAGHARTWPIDRDALGLGRASANAIHLPDATVSKEHARIVRRHGAVWVQDLGSRNGTRVNGRDASEPIELRAGDMLEIGHVALRVADPDAPSPPGYSDATVLGSSMRVEVAALLAKRAAGAAAEPNLVHLLAEAGQMLVLPRPLGETCDELLGVVERAFPATRSVVLLRDGDGEEARVVATREPGGAPDRPLALSRTIARTVMDECTAVLTADAANDPRFAGAASIVAQAVRSAMAVPLFDNRRVIGLLYVDRPSGGAAFDGGELEVLTLLANMAAVKISNARLLEAEQARARMAHELASAARIQRSLLVATPPAVAGLECDGFLESCFEVGGDLYDLQPRTDGRLLVLIGDVSGKGMGAALLMSSFLASARSLDDLCGDPGDLATRLSDLMARSAEPGRFVTGILGWLEPSSGRFAYVNAGHPAALVVSAAGVRELASTGIPFGILPGTRYAAAETDLAPGETLVLFSDGVPEAQRGDDFYGEDRLREVVARAGAGPLATLRDAVLADVDAFLAGAPRTDDLTLLLVRRTAG